MLSAKNAVACLLVFALLGCTPVASVIDNEGMQSLEGDARTWPLALTESVSYIPLSSSAQKGEVKIRLLVSTDGKVKKATFLEGSKGLWRDLYNNILSFDFSVTPRATIPGPWELDMVIKITTLSNLLRERGIELNELSTLGTNAGEKTGQGRGFSFTPVSYRTAVL